MRNKIQCLANGQIELEKNPPIAQPEKIEKQLEKNEIFEGSFTIKSSCEQKIRGLLYTDNPLLKLKEKSFYGVQAIIHYEVSAFSLHLTGYLNATIFIETNDGNLEIPCHFTSEETDTTGYEGMPETMDDLVNMAKDWPQGARMVFSLPEFSSKRFMKGKISQLFYKGLKKETPQPYFLEEFLIATKKKSPVTFHVEPERALIKVGSKGRVGNFYVVLDQWGATDIKITSMDTFIEVNKTELIEEDFKDDQVLVSYRLNQEYMHGGNNYGKIIVESPYCKCEVEIVGFIDSEVEDEIDCRNEIFKFTDTHIRLLENGLDNELLIEDLKKSLEVIRKKDPKNLKYLLIEAYFDLKSGRKEEALELLKPIKNTIIIDKEKTPFYYAMYLLITDNEEVCTFLKSQLQKEEGIKSLLFLLATQVDEDFRKDEFLVYQWAKKLYNIESKSRYFIAIGAKCLLKNPNMIQRIDEFETCIFRYLLNKNELTSEIANLACLPNNSNKRFRPVLFRMYQRIYELYPLKGILKNICELLIRADCQGEKYFSWYEKGVKEDVRITRLYDYYIYSLPENFNERFPKTLVLYYSYDRPIDVQIYKKLYCNVTEFYSQDELIYSRYKEIIKDYVEKVLIQDSLDPEIAILYEKNCDLSKMDSILAKKLYTLLFTHKISCNNQNITSLVCSTYDGQVEVPFRKGIAYIPIFSSEYVIILQDTQKRQLTHVEYTDTLVYENERLKEQCELLIPEHPIVMDHYLMQVMTKDAYTKEDITLFEQYINDEKMNESLKKQLMHECIEYYSKNQKASFDVAVLMEAKSLVEGKDFLNFVHMLISHHYYSEAFNLIKENGCEMLDEQLVFKLCRCLLKMAQIGYDEYLVAMDAWLFKKGYSDIHLLSYLSQYYQGDIKSTTQIVKDCHREKISCDEMTSELLERMLFVGEEETIDEIYDYYQEIKEKNKVVQTAYLVQKCHRYVIGRTTLSDRIYKDLQEIFSYLENQNWPESVRLGLLKYYANKKELLPEEETVMEELLYKARKDKIQLSFVEKAAVRLKKPGMMLIETDVRSGDTTKIRYKINNELEVHEEEMDKSYGGIFVKEVVLFSDETLDFQIDEEEEMEVSCPDYLQNGSNRYALINQMAMNPKEKSTFIEYEKTRRLVNKNYELL